MKILQFCYKPPYPAVDGGAMGMHSIAEGLTNLGCKVKILTFYSDKNPFQKELLSQSYIETYNPEAIYVNLKPNIFDALLYVLIARSYIVERFVCSAMKNRLIKILQREQFDIIQLESINLVPYIPIIHQFSDAKISFHCPNVEYLIWQRLYKNEKHNIFKRWYLKNLSNNMRFYEQSHINDFDIIFPITDIDKQSFIDLGCKKPCLSVPIGMDAIDKADNVVEQENTLFHIGSMNWFPNEQGINWLLTDVWQKIIDLVPEVSLYLAGRHMPMWLQNYNAKNVNIVGEVADSTTFISSKQIMIVPLLSGSGIRIKILEAMSLGKAVIATSIAAEGIMYENGKNIIIADTPEDIAQAVKKLIDDKDYCHLLGENAQRLIKEEYNTTKIASKILEEYEKLIEK